MNTVCDYLLNIFNHVFTQKTNKTCIKPKASEYQQESLVTFTKNYAIKEEKVLGTWIVPQGIHQNFFLGSKINFFIPFVLKHVFPQILFP